MHAFTIFIQSLCASLVVLFLGKYCCSLVVFKSLGSIPNGADPMGVWFSYFLLLPTFARCHSELNSSGFPSQSRIVQYHLLCLTSFSDLRPLFTAVQLHEGTPITSKRLSPFTACEPNCHESLTCISYRRRLNHTIWGPESARSAGKDWVQGSEL